MVLGDRAGFDRGNRLSYILPDWMCFQCRRHSGYSILMSGHFAWEIENVIFYFAVKSSISAFS